MRLSGAIVCAALTVGCASSGAVPSPFPRPGSPERLPESVSSADSGAVVGTALSLRGAPYRNGGSDPSGFDCSGFVAYVFAQQGVFVPRTVIEQYDQGTHVDPAMLAAGDLIFFSTVAPGPSHVAIAISPEEFVHAPSSSGIVRVEALRASYWASRLIGVRRFP